MESCIKIGGIMEAQNFLYAKELFYKYDGNFYQMKRDAVYDIYKNQMVPKELELQWIKEKRDELTKILLECTNCKKIAEAFARYGHYASQLKDEEMFDFMTSYVFEHINNWDINTMYRNINVILSSINIIKTQSRKKEVVSQCAIWLENALNSNAEISDDYREDGVMPAYLSKEKVLANIQATIKYWRDKSRVF